MLPFILQPLLDPIYGRNLQILTIILDCSQFIICLTLTMMHIIYAPFFFPASIFDGPNPRLAPQKIVTK